MVDNKGIHYKRYDGSTDSILYSALKKNNDRYQGDVYAVSVRRGSSLLKVIGETGPITVIFQTDFTWSWYTGNVFTLRGHFIRGIRLFRPDLTISDNVFIAFYINRHNFTFEGRSYILMIVIVTVLLVVLLFGGLWFANSRLH